MPKFEFDRMGFKTDGRDQFMNSGEFHYFRVPAEDWKRRTELFKEAGGNCLATYVPWLIHEPEEGNIVFGDVPNRDLVRFLETAKTTKGIAVLKRLLNTPKKLPLSAKVIFLTPASATFSVESNTSKAPRAFGFRTAGS